MRDWLAAREDVTPRSTALSGPENVSYATIDERVETLAGRLGARGVGVDAALVVVLETREVFVDLVYAAQRLGAVFVPLNARLTATELQSRLDRIDPAVVVCGADTETTCLEAANAPVLSVDDPDAGAEPLAATDPEPFEIPEWGLEDPLVVSFTSGTTGDPKGVILTAGNVLASAAASAFRLGVLPDDCWHVPLSMYHTGGLAPVYRSVLYGTALSVGSGSFDPVSTLESMREAEASCVSVVPTMLERLLEADSSGTLSALRVVLLGGAPCPEELLVRAHDRGVAVAPTYGMTEAASQIATARPAEARANPGTVGTPVMFAEVRIVDDAGVPCDSGETGEILVDGPMVTRGYLDEEETAAAFCNGGLRTGDVGHRDAAGRLWIHGRRDEQILTGGENVDPTEVVEALCEHPAVAEAAVIGVADPEWGERVAALVVRSDDVDAAELQAHCRGRLAGYKLPRTIGFTEALPRTVSGTVDREAVRQRLSALE